MTTPARGHHFRILPILFIATLLLPACASKNIYLNDTERAYLRKQPAIHVVHYATALPEVRPPTVKRHYAKVKLHDTPSGAEIQGNLGNFNPTLEVTQRFVKNLSKSAGLGNLRTERNSAPLPVLKDLGQFKEKYKTGAVLEVWIQRWGFHYTPIDWKTYTLTLNAHARLSRVDNGQLLWTIGECSYGGSGNTYDDRIVLGDLKTSDSKKVQAKIKQTVGRIAEECARQLMHDFSRDK
jgi:hypothetical protein